MHSVRCPFCGLDYIAITSDKNEWHYIICSNCSARGPLTKSAKDALEAWEGRK